MAFFFTQRSSSVSSLRAAWLAKWFIAVGLGILGIFGLLSLIPIPTTIDTTRDAATIHFSANHWLVFSNNTCITVDWAVEHIREVYLNGDGVIGSGEQPVCVHLNSQFALRVVFQDGKDKIYKLNIPILLTYPVVWILVVASLTLLILAVGLFGIRLIRRWRRVKLVLQALAGTTIALGLALVLLEIGLRLYYTSSGTADEQFLYTTPRDQIVNTLALQYPLLVAPDVNDVLNPDYLGHDQLGYRGPEVVIPKPKGVFRIVVLGDSVTYGLALSPDQAYPVMIQQILHDDYGYKNVEVVNGGVPNYSSWDVLTDLSFHVLELDPDLVIISQNWIDIRSRTVSPDCYQGINPLRGLDPHRQVATPDIAENPTFSSLYRYMAVSLGWMPDTYTYEFNQYDNQLCQRDDGGSDEEHVKENPPTYFRRNLRNIVAVAQANGVKVLLSTQAFYRQTVPKWIPDWEKEGADEQNRIIQEVASETKAGFFDLMGTINQDSRFWIRDGLHLRPEGAQEYGRLFAAYLVKTGWLDETP
jgi:lysophospholipase L1-like esterase